ncbi:MAG: Holliday junction branch migration protein RuvA [Candidatus Moranbacteria bacterium]|nr:Holliday junction branch migration protein RuvA [Candidatus Moranbacteria bacterium]
MLSRIIGKVVEKNDNSLVILVSGIGINVFVTNNLYAKTQLKENLDLFTCLVVRENLLNLYGFESKEQSDFFELLLSISGIGPKGALGILEQAGPRELKESIQMSDYTILTQVSGIGKKTAERIVLELKNKLGRLNTVETADPKNNQKTYSKNLEAMQALEALGYSNSEARQALKKTEKETGQADVGEKVKAALKILGKK